MKWIAVAILVVIVPYTFLTLHYRKPGPAFRPYEDMKNRANTLRLLSAGYQRITLEAMRPALPGGNALAAPTAPAAAGVPGSLKSTLVDAPSLPAEILSVTAASATSAAAAYPIQFTCTLPDNKRQLAGAELYVRPDEIVITPTFEPITGGLLARTRENVILLTVPGGTLKPGRYHVTIAGQQSSRAWTLQVH